MDGPTERNKRTEPTGRDEHTIGANEWEPATQCRVPNRTARWEDRKQVENDDVGYLPLGRISTSHQDYVWKMPAGDRIMEESTSPQLAGRQRAGVVFCTLPRLQRRELVELVGCCSLGRTPLEVRTAVSPSRYTPTHVGS